MNHQSRFKILPVLALCLVLLGLATVLTAQVQRVVASGAVVLHNPDAKPGAVGTHRSFNHQSAAAGISCFGSCDCGSCTCYGDFNCCVAGCGGCFIVACGGT